MAVMSKTALLVIDMQNRFTDMTKASLPQVLGLSEQFRRNQWLQFFTQHGHSRDELSGEASNQLVKKWGANGSIATGAQDWELMRPIEEVWIAAGMPPIVAKNTYDAFLNTNLDNLLRSRAVERVVVCGVMTDCCVDTTARSAFNRGYETLVISDACGSANEAQHSSGLRAFGFAFGEVMTTQHLLARLTAERDEVRE